MFISSVSTSKVQTCNTDATIAAVAKQMRTANVGDVVIVEERNGTTVPISLITDRDLVVYVMAKRLNPETTTVMSIPHRNLVTAYEGEQLEVAAQRMRWCGIRRIPLVDSAGALIGIICLDDVLHSLAMTMQGVLCIGHNQALEERMEMHARAHTDIEVPPNRFNGGSPAL